jgi:hypothetical protein
MFLARNTEASITELNSGDQNGSMATARVGGFGWSVDLERDLV